MRRRSFLAAVSATVVAGCTESGGASTETGPEPSNTDYNATPADPAKERGATETTPTPDSRGVSPAATFEPGEWANMADFAGKNKPIHPGTSLAELLVRMNPLGFTTEYVDAETGESVTTVDDPVFVGTATVNNPTAGGVFTPASGFSYGVLVGEPGAAELFSMSSEAWDTSSPGVCPKLAYDAGVTITGRAGVGYEETLTIGYAVPIPSDATPVQSVAPTVHNDDGPIVAWRDD